MSATPGPWLRFIAALQKQGVSFEDIQHSDAKDREDLINEVAGDFSKVERIVLNSHWNKLNNSALTSTNTNQNYDLTTNSQQSFSSPGGALSRVSTNNNNAAPNNNINQQANGGVLLPGSKDTQTIGNYLVSGDGISYAQSAGPFDPTSLRASLSRGDATSALPLASEMLQKDPLALCGLLHEYAPHLTVATIKSILGLDGGPPGRGLPPSITASTGEHSTLRFGNFEGNDISGGGGNNNNKRNNRDQDSTIAMVNGQSVPVGQVLTSVALSGLYGQGFSITCNGQLVHLPYCVQPGDRILVTAAEVRI